MISFVDILSSSHFIVPWPIAKLQHKKKRLETWTGGPTMHSLTHKTLNCQEHYQEDSNDEEKLLNPKTQKIWPPKSPKSYPLFLDKRCHESTFNAHRSSL